MKYNINTCPKDKLWFIEGGECGTAVECISCNKTKLEDLSIIIQKDQSQKTSIQVEDISAGVISIRQVYVSDSEDANHTEDNVYLTIEMLLEINNVVGKIPFDDELTDE